MNTPLKRFLWRKTSVLNFVAVKYSLH